MDLEHKLLNGKPIDIGVGKLYPLTYDEIVEMGISKYERYMLFLIFEPEDFEGDSDKTTSFQMIIDGCRDKKTREFILEAFSLFFHEEVRFLNKHGIFFLGGIEEGRIIDEEKFDEVRNVLMKMGGRKKKKIKKLSKRRKRFQELKKKYGLDKNDKGITLIEIVSSLCSKHPSINLTNVGSLSIYQIMDQFKRLGMIEKYEIDIKALMNGAKKEDISLKHWSEKL